MERMCGSPLYHELNGGDNPFTFVRGDKLERAVAVESGQKPCSLPMNRGIEAAPREAPSRSRRFSPGLSGVSHLVFSAFSTIFIGFIGLIDRCNLQIGHTLEVDGV